MGLAVVACTPKSAETTEGETAEAAEAQETPKEKTAKDYIPGKAVTDSVSYLLGINFGGFLKNYNFGSDLNYAQMKKGMTDYLNAKGSPRDPEFGEQFKINPEKMNDLFNAFLENRHNYTLCVNREKEEAFLAKNAKAEGIVTTESGLQYRIIEPGSELKPSAKDTVWVKYCGKLLDGTVFDETAEDQEPVRLLLNHVVKGWAEGLQLIGEGGKIDLFIPAKLGYGEQGTRGIEPNSTLLFNVELTKVGVKVEESK